MEDFVKQVFIGFKLGIKKVKELWMLLRVEKKTKENDMAGTIQCKTNKEIM